MKRFFYGFKNVNGYFCSFNFEVANICCMVFSCFPHFFEAPSTTLDITIIYF